MSTATADVATNRVTFPEMPEPGSIRVNPAFPVVGTTWGTEANRYVVRRYAPGMATALADLVFISAGADLTGAAVRGSTDFSDQAKQILGPQTVSRLEMFRKYRANWNGSDAPALSPKSVSSLDAFVRMQGGFPTIPSLFLNEGGNLVLGWENRNGHSIEAEFAAERWIVYLVDDDEKIEMPISSPSIRLLAHKLS